MMDKSLRDIVGRKDLFVFDWDGTIADTMQIKGRNFAQSLVETSSYFARTDCGSIQEEYFSLSGKPRREIFAAIMRQRGKVVIDTEFNRFSKKFTQLNSIDLKQAKVFQDAEELLRELIARKIELFISSSAPEEELRPLVRNILKPEIYQGIRGILGSDGGFSKGGPHLQFILTETKKTRQEVLVIGDDIADHELSQAAMFDNILIRRSGALLDGVCCVRNLREIEACLR